MPPQKKKNAAASAGSVKKRMRGLERLLQRGGLPDDVRRSKEAELAALKGEAGKKRKSERERHFSKKYHGVKFIERRKVERRIAQLKRQLDGGGGAAQASSLEEALREAEHDLLYITHFPRSKKYLALFPAEGADDPYVTKRRGRIRALIIRRIEAGLPVGDGERDGEEEAAADDDEAAVEDDDFFGEAEAEADEDDGSAGVATGSGAPSDAKAEAEAEAERRRRRAEKKQKREREADQDGAGGKRRKKEKKKRAERAE